MYCGCAAACLSHHPPGSVQVASGPSLMSSAAPASEAPRLDMVDMLERMYDG
jgi:hypothetical protein